MCVGGQNEYSNIGFKVYFTLLAYTENPECTFFGIASIGNVSNVIHVHFQYMYRVYNVVFPLGVVDSVESVNILYHLVLLIMRS